MVDDKEKLTGGNNKHMLFVCKIGVVICLVLFFVGINIYIKQYMRGVFETNDEFVKTIDCAPVFDDFSFDSYIIEFEAKAKKGGKLLVYQQNGSGQRYFFAEEIEVTTEYSEYRLQVQPILLDEEQKESFLAFYGEYGSGVVPIVRNIKILDLDGNELT